jgi:hydrogenase maturation factor
VLNVNGNEETKIEQIRALYRLVQNYSDRLTFVENGYDRIIQFVINELADTTVRFYFNYLTNFRMRIM